MLSSIIISKLQNFAQIIFYVIGTKRIISKWFLKIIGAPKSFYPNSSNPAHSVGVIKDKMCILKMQDTLLSQA